jgi:hypothetical protein
MCTAANFFPGLLGEWQAMKKIEPRSNTEMKNNWVVCAGHGAALDESTEKSYSRAGVIHASGMS